MPELPEVETVRLGLEKAWLGRTITKVILRRPNLRYPFPEDFEKQLVGQKITAIRRRAKYLLIDTDGDLVFLSHLGMSGKYTIFDAQKVSQYDLSIPDSKSAFGGMSGFDGRHDHMEIRFDDGSVSVYTDPRRFGIVKLFHRAEETIQPLLEVLGPEPFDDLDDNGFWTGNETYTDVNNNGQYDSSDVRQDCDVQLKIETITSAGSGVYDIVVHYKSSEPIGGYQMKFRSDDDVTPGVDGDDAVLVTAAAELTGTSGFLVQGTTTIIAFSFSGGTIPASGLIVNDEGDEVNWDDI